MDDFKPNSHRFKEEQKANNKAVTHPEKKIEKVVSGQVKTRKRSGTKKFLEHFVSEDASNIKEFAIGDVLIPSLKRAFSEMLKGSVDMIFGTGGSRRGSSTPYVSYDKKYGDRFDRPAREPSLSRAFSFEDIVLESRVEADEVLDRMQEIIDTYGMVSVADLHELVGIGGHYTNQKYGWTSLRSARVVRARDGYILDLPRVQPL